MREFDRTEVLSPVNLNGQKVVGFEVRKSGGAEWAVFTCHHEAMNHLNSYVCELPFGATKAELNRVAEHVVRRNGVIDRKWFERGIAKKNWSDLFKHDGKTIEILVSA